MKSINKNIYNINPIRFGIVGEYQSGKSLLINCLLKRPIATVGVGIATTHTVVNYRYADKEYVKFIDAKCKEHIIKVEEVHSLDTATDIAVIDVYLSIDLLKYYILTDMPGFGANNNDDSIAKKVLEHLDFAILVTSNDKELGAESSAFKDIHMLHWYNIPYYLILNCRNTDRWEAAEENNRNIAEKDYTLLQFYKPLTFPLNEDGINIVNFMWYWFSIQNESDELLQRHEIRSNINIYGLNDSKVSIKDVRIASNFDLINKIFNMENRAYLELRKEFKEEISKLKDEICPIGTIQVFAFKYIPDGWMVCDGSKIDPNKYHDLFKAIGITFGGDGITSFSIPDLRGRFIRGWDNKGDVDPEREFGSAQKDALQGHSHSIVSCSESGNHHHRVGSKQWCRDYANTFFTSLNYKDLNDYGADTIDYSTNTTGSHRHDIVIGEPVESSFGHIRMAQETRPKNLSLIYCIKAKSF